MSQLMWRTVLVEPGRFAREQVPVPVPGPGDVLIRVSRVGICGSDISAFYGRHVYMRCPVVLGHEFSGTVAAQGPDTHGPAVGTRVCVLPHRPDRTCRPCRKGQYNHCPQLQVIGCFGMNGAHAEYVTVPADMAFPLPDFMSFETAALVEPAAVGWHAIQRTGLHSGERVLIVGAGPIGNFTMQCARLLGAQAYIADLDPRRLSLAAGHGAAGALDLSSETLAAGLDSLAGGAQEIALFADCVGHRGEAFNAILEVAPKGSRLLGVGIMGQEVEVPHLLDLVEHELTYFGSSMYVAQDYLAVLAHLNAGGLRTEGMVTHRFSLEAVPEAFALIDTRREPHFKILLEAE